MKYGLLQQTFLDLCSRYSADEALINNCWKEIETAHTQTKRYYHNLDHLTNLLVQLTAASRLINNWDGVLFALYYHDIVYNPVKKDNEEKSAVLAVKRLKALTVQKEFINECEQMILATKTHQPGNNIDAAFFTDADLSILGADLKTYQQYCKQVRKEYSIFPDVLYKPGRRKVLQHFIDMQPIYKTDHFFALFETTAKQNLSQELATLS